MLVDRAKHGAYDVLVELLDVCRAIAAGDHARVERAISAASRAEQARIARLL